MKLTSSNFYQLFTPELKQLIHLFETRSYDLRIAGGAVRDLLMGELPHDLDLATVATPTEMKSMFEAEGVRMINNKGESHGTITARIGEQNFEVTTLRIDVLTDGRRAKVQFTQDWQLDGNRRDLTINAMFLGFDGTVYDYFNGIQDLENRYIRFVGEPEERIQEDFLRIMRYFRFYGRIAPVPNSHESPTLEAIKRNVHGLAGISGERLWLEFRKILSGNFQDAILECMHELGVTQYLGLPSNLDLPSYREVCNRSRMFEPLPSTLLTSLLTSYQQVDAVNSRLKMSNDQVSICYFIIDHRDDDIGHDPERYFQDIYTDVTKHSNKLNVLLRELMKYKGDKNALDSLATFTPKKFAVTGYDLFDAHVPKGPEFSRIMTTLRTLWKESGYTLTKDELLSKIPELSKSTFKGNIYKDNLC